jgi:hypothetical protein
MARSSIVSAAAVSLFGRSERVMLSHGPFAIISGLSPEEAMSEVVKQGGAVGVKRNGDPRLLKIWLDGSDK